MAARRPMGALEDSVMAYLWSRTERATPAEVHAVVGRDLAYTTVMTILTRLWEKGLLERKRRGRAYAYRPVRSEADHRAEHMRTTLDRARDREAVLSSFVDGLSTSEARTLRRLLRDES